MITEGCLKGSPLFLLIASVLFGVLRIFLEQVQFDI